MSSNVPTVTTRTIRKILSPETYFEAMIRARDSHGRAGLGITRGGDDHLRKQIFLAMREVRKSGALEPFAKHQDLRIREVIAWNLFVAGDNGVPHATMMSTPLAFAIYSAASYAAAEMARNIREERAPVVSRRKRRGPEVEFSFQHLAFFRDKALLHREFTPDENDLLRIARAASEAAVQAACGNLCHDSFVDLLDHDDEGQGVVVLPVTRESVFRPLVARIGRICGEIIPLSSCAEDLGSPA